MTNKKYVLLKFPMAQIRERKKYRGLGSYRIQYVVNDGEKDITVGDSQKEAWENAVEYIKKYAF